MWQSQLSLNDNDTWWHNKIVTKGHQILWRFSIFSLQGTFCDGRYMMTFMTMVFRHTIHFVTNSVLSMTLSFCYKSPNCFVVNPIQHARTKNIDVCYHFIRDHQQKEDICIKSVGTDDQLADIFTKPLDEKRFCKLRNELNILDFSNMCWCTPTIWHASPSSKAR